MQKKKLLQKLMSICVIICFLLSVGAGSSVSKAAEISKITKTYDIAVVFDNSGSMYANKAWCRAKYAMEIFASMLNYENGDSLTIFPMWEVTTDGKSKKGGSYKPIKINNLAGIDKISKLYTTNPSNTPFEPITEAYNYLKQSDASKEKWLIVLTDGEFNQNKRGKGAAINLQKKLSSIASNEIKIQYLGFGAATKLNSKPNTGFYAEKSTDASIKDDLIAICNTIFKRSELPKGSLKGEKLNLDLSMKKIIVFAQGKGATVSSLKDDAGKSIAKLLDSGQRKYSKIKAEDYDSAPVDDTLYGQVVTFDSCPKGTYTLNCSGADAVQIFYEPDVDLGIRLENSDGQEVIPEDGKITADTYKVYYGITDNITKEDVTKSVLMGDNVSLNGTLVEGEGNESKLENGGSIKLEPGKKIYFKITGKYLEDYTITTEDNKEMFTFVIEEEKVPPKNEMTIKAKVEQKNKWYQLSKHDEWKPIRIDLRYNGDNLTDEQLGQVQWNIETNEPIEWKMELLQSESAANIYIGIDKSGQYIEPEIGSYKMNMSARMVDEYGRDVIAEDQKVSFTVQKYPGWIGILLKWLPWIIAFVVLLVAFIIFMNQKILPKAQARNDDFHFYHGLHREIHNVARGTYSRKDKKATAKCRVPQPPDKNCDVTFYLEPVDRRWIYMNKLLFWKHSKPKPRIAIVNVNTGSALYVEKIEIGAHELVKINNRWRDADYPENPIRIVVNNNMEFDIITQRNNSRLVGKYTKI